MSGIVGVVHLDGSPVDHQLVQELTDFLSFRGPHRQQTHIHDNIGLSHALLKTTEEIERDFQPLSLNGESWVIADARIDAREELVMELRSAGQRETAPSGWTDAELLLRSYEAWGENCVEHLLGDFSFAIWDEARRQLFCARDHMGVKPFYYAQIGACVVFSNTLDCVRRHPLVSDKLNDLAIADFLLFGVNQDPAGTSFHDIRRIPPAHFISWSARQITMRRYWMMPIDEPILYKRADAYICEFRQLLNKCVDDRLRSNAVSIFMSGGLDSTTLAATAHERLSRQYGDFELRAVTKIDSFAVEEQRYAAAAADHLGIPIQYDHWMQGADPEWERIPFRSPEPYPYAWTIPAEEKFWKQLLMPTPVFLYGEGPDNALHCDWAPYLSGLLSRGRYREVLSAVFMTLAFERRLPSIGKLLNAVASPGVKRGLARPTKCNFPRWLNPSFESRLSLRDGWSADRPLSQAKHPWRPIGYASLHNPLWQATFESFDFLDSRACHERWYPFVDIRMLRFLLAVPVLPWCRSKRLIRASMRGRLPNSVLSRRKKPTDSSKLFAFFENLCRLPLVIDGKLGDYVDMKRFSSTDWPTQDKLRVRSLNHWLQHSRAPQHNPVRESLVGESTWRLNKI